MKNLRCSTVLGRLVWIGAVLVAAACGGDGKLSPSGDGGAGSDGPGSIGGPIEGDPNAKADYPDAILCLPGNTDRRCGPGFDPNAPLSPADLAAALTEGLAAWTDPTSTNGACINCHTPDGIDLAKIGFSDCDIHRRALDHVDEARANAIVALIHAQRQVYQIEKPLHPDRFRPLQPTFEPFEQPADDVEITDRDRQAVWDEEFMNYLQKDLGLIIANTRIESLEQAHQAYQQLLALDLHNLKLGIPFDHFSEDPNASDNVCGQTGGPARAGKSIFEWVSGIAVEPKAGKEAEWTALLDQYRADPSTVNLWRYYDKIDELLECAYLPTDGDWTRACDWMRHKYKSMQVLQHMLRHDLKVHPDQLADLRTGGADPQPHQNIDLMIARSPIWETADLIRVAPLERPGDPACEPTEHPCTNLPPRVDETIHNEPTHQLALVNQGDLFQVSWFVMSFLNDPTLTLHSQNFATFIGDYLESVLLPRYDVHHAFIFHLMAAHKAAASQFFDAAGFRQGVGKIASVRTFSFKQIRRNFSPPTGVRLETHQRLFANFARMWIFLVEEDLRKSGTVYGRDGQFGGPSDNGRGGLLSAVRFMRTWPSLLEGADDPAINDLVKKIETEAAAATELRSQENYEDYDGLQPNGDWADFQEPYTGG